MTSPGVPATQLAWMTSAGGFLFDGEGHDGGFDRLLLMSDPEFCLDLMAAAFQPPQKLSLSGRRCCDVAPIDPPMRFDRGDLVGQDKGEGLACVWDAGIHRQLETWGGL